MGVSGKLSKKTQTAPGGGGQGSTPSQGSKTAATGQGGQPTAPCQGGQSASSSGSGRPATSGGPPLPPPDNRGHGDNVGNDWYQQTMRKAEGRASRPEEPPYPIGMAEARRSAVGQIYDQVSGKAPPLDNIASEALWAYYTRVDTQTINTWVCQILCMIAEYHMACVTQGSPVTSLLVPRELAERLPPAANYTPPDDQSGTTDIRVRDHRARTLRVAVFCHCLDMALSKKPASSRSLVRSRHHMGNLLAYFLGPSTAWELQFQDVISQVLKENQKHVEKRRLSAASTLHNCNKRCVTLWAESMQIGVHADRR